jgi:hypothetical protein
VFGSFAGLGVNPTTYNFFGQLEEIEMTKEILLGLNMMMFMIGFGCDDDSDDDNEKLASPEVEKSSQTEDTESSQTGDTESSQTEDTESSQTGDTGSSQTGDIDPKRICTDDDDCAITYGGCDADWIAIRADEKTKYEEVLSSECGGLPEWDQPTAWPLAGCIENRCEIMGIDPVDLEFAKECSHDTDCTLVKLHCMEDCDMVGVNTTWAEGYKTWLDSYCEAYEGPLIQWECDEQATVCTNGLCS